MTHEPRHDSAIAWARWGEFVHDMAAFYRPLLLVPFCCVFVLFAELQAYADSTGPTWMVGCAAMVTAVAAVAEARRGDGFRAQVADIEVRVRVLEEKGSDQ